MYYYCWNEDDKQVHCPRHHDVRGSSKKRVLLRVEMIVMLIGD